MIEKRREAIEEGSTMARIGFRTAGIVVLAGLTGGIADRVGATAEATSQTTWLVVQATSSAPAPALQDAIARLGGTIVSTYPEIGTLVVESPDPDFRTAAAAISGVSSVVPNVPLQIVAEGDDAEYDGGNGGLASLPADEPFYPFQWGLHAIHAKGAWDAGYTGAGARVAVLDLNFDISHPDLAPNINPNLARSFVPGEPVTPGPTVTFSHGTHVAGIIAATANGVGTVGVAPDAELVPIKVISDANSFQLPWFLDGLRYAVAVEADVVNMSFGMILLRSGGCLPPGVATCLTAKDVRDIVKIVRRAIQFARRNGVTLVAAGGNLAGELDRGDDIIGLPAESRGVLAVSATGPVDWALDPTTDLDVPESYTNYGANVVYLAAPGGFVGSPPGPTCDLGLDLGVGPIPCRWFDKTLSTNFPHPYWFGGGTSFATPHVTGVAALIVGKSGGAMSPGRVQAILRRSADDLGTHGRDAFYGWGRVNAERAIAMTPD